MCLSSGMCSSFIACLKFFPVSFPAVSAPVSPQSLRITSTISMRLRNMKYHTILCNTKQYDIVWYENIAPVWPGNLTKHTILLMPFLHLLALSPTTIFSTTWAREWGESRHIWSWAEPEFSRLVRLLLPALTSANHRHHHLQHHHKTSSTQPTIHNLIH